MNRRAANRRNTDGGQATVELALGLPVLCVMTLAVVQVAVVVGHRVAVQLAAREAARAASVTADPDAGTTAANRAVALRPLRVVVEESSDHTIIATVTYTDPTDIPIIGLLLPDVVLEATVTMAVEPP